FAHTGDEAVGQGEGQVTGEADRAADLELVVQGAGGGPADLEAEGAGGVLGVVAGVVQEQVAVTGQSPSDQDNTGCRNDSSHGRLEAHRPPLSGQPADAIHSTCAGHRATLYDGAAGGVVGAGNGVVGHGVEADGVGLDAGGGGEALHAVE